MFHKSRKTVADITALCGWASTAPAGDFVVYHVGNLGRDRVENPALHQLAETVHLMQECGWVVGSSVPLHLAGFMGTSYGVTRTGRGFLPREVLHQRLTAAEWYALRAVRDRDPDYSAVRAIRDALSCSENHAADLMALLYARGLVRAAEVGKGYELTPDGLRALL